MTYGLADLGQVVRWERRWLRTVAVLGLLAPVAAGAAALAEPHASTVRKVVEARVDAFAVDDAERAFSYASASIQAKFGDAAIFIAMGLRDGDAAGRRLVLAGASGSTTFFSS